MPYYVRRTEDGKWVSHPGSKKSYTNDFENAREFDTAKEAQNEACGNESIWYIVDKPRMIP